MTPAQQFLEALYAGQSGLLELRTVPAGNTPEERVVAARLRDFVPVSDGRVDMNPVERFLAATGNLTETKITVTRDTETVTAEVTGRAARLLPGFAWSVTARAQAPVERFIPEPER